MKEMSEKLRVLYVDDNPHDRDLVNDALAVERSDFELTISADRKEFEGHLDSGEWDIVLSDLNILGYSGLQVIQTVKERSPATPVIIITGTGSEEMAARSIKAGAADYVIKSISHIKRLPESIRKAIQLQKAENEKRRAKAVLKKREAELLRAQHVAHIGSWTFDPAGRMPVWSDEMFCIFGLSPKSGTPSYDDHRQIMHPDDWEVFDTAVQRAVREGDEFDLELRILRPDGEIRYVNTKCEVLRDERGAVAELLGTTQDISERIETEKELRQSEERFRQLFENMTSGVAVYEAVDNGEDFVFRDFNKAAERIENVSRDKLLGRPVSEVVPGVKEFGVFSVFQRVWRTGQPEYFEPHIFRDGQGTDSWREAWVYRLGSGEVVSIYNDVTGRKRAEEELRESRARLELATSAANIGYWDWNVVENTVYFSSHWKRQLGYENHELADRFEEWESRLHRDDRNLVMEAVSDYLEDRIPEYRLEFRLRHRDGSYRWIYTRGEKQLDSNGEPCRLVGCHVDITERKEAEIKLRKAKEQLTSLVGKLIDSLIVTDHTGAIRFVNKAACEFFGRERGELIGAPFGFPIILDKIFEISSQSPTGAIRHAEAQSTRIDWYGEPSYLLSLRDITVRRRAMDEREKMNKHMQDVERIESIGKLAGGVAHDFNNMLSVITCCGDELLEELHPTDPLHEAAKEIVEAGRRSAALTRQLLAFSRRQTLQPEVLDLNFIVRNIEKMLGRLIGEDIELRTVLAEGLSPVKVDPGQIEQVIVNLAVNARDAMPQGGRLTIETANSVVDEEYAATHVSVTPGEYVMLSITDSGSGMDEETRSKIFEPFFTTKEKGRGTGLGLSTAYGIVKQSGGYIWVYSEPGQGSTFKIYLPESSEALTGEKVRGTDDSIKGNGQMILVVEDDPSVRLICEKILKVLHYRVVTAANGGEALLLVEEKNLCPDLIVTDVVMPEMSGQVLIDRLRKNRPDLKVLYMSGYTDDSIVHHGILEAGVPFIQKPFSKSKLGEAVKLALIGAG